MRPLLALVGIFKDEASVIARTLESAEPFVEQIILDDTGSTDRTKIVMREVCGEKLRLFERSFDDFASARNANLQHAAAFADAATFSISLSSDETLVGGEALRSFLNEHRDASDGAYSIEIQAGARTWTYPRVFRTGTEWRYVGEVHEIPVGPSGETVAPIIPGVKIIHVVSDAARRLERVREFDLPTITRIASDQRYTLAERCKYIFMLADTHTALAAELPQVPGGEWLTHQMTAMSLYWRAAQIMEASENPAHDLRKAVYAYFFFFHLADKIGLFNSEELASRLHALAEVDPISPEVRFLLAKHGAIVDARQGLFLATEAARVAREARNNPTYLPTDSRIAWQAMRIAADCAKALDQVDTARKLAEDAVADGGPKEAFVDHLVT
jgi:hypothetical protein